MIDLVCVKYKTKMSIMYIDISIVHPKSRIIYYGDHFKCYTCGNEMIASFGESDRLSEN